MMRFGTVRSLSGKHQTFFHDWYLWEVSIYSSDQGYMVSYMKKILLKVFIKMFQKLNYIVIFPNTFTGFKFYSINYDICFHWMYFGNLIIFTVIEGKTWCRKTSQNQKKCVSWNPNVPMIQDTLNHWRVWEVNRALTFLSCSKF